MPDIIKKYKLDIIVISAILLVATVALLFLFVFRREGASVEVTVDGVTVGSYPLEKNASYDISGYIPDGHAPSEDGGSTTHVLVIENGVAYILRATCEGQQCVKMGKIKYVGQSIICAYHRVEVKVKGGRDDGVDIVS